MKPFDLSGKRALITGGSKGIGLGIAQAYAEAGADLILVARDQVRLEESRANLAHYKGTIDIFPYDMAQTAGISSFFAEVVTRSGPIDIVVNSAGVTRRGPSESFGAEDWDLIIATNLTSVFRIAQAFVRHRIEQQKPGKILNIASLTSEAARKGIAAYVASKGGIRQLTKAMAVDWAEYHINVNAIGPGYIKTELTTALYSDPEFDAWVKKRTPLGRWGLPSDIGATAVFLASSAADFITGQIIYVDGGFLATF